MTHVISVTFEAVGRLQEKFLIQVGRVSLFAAALAGVVIMGPTLPRFAVAWLCVQVLEYLAYVVAARVRLGSSIQVMTLQLARGWHRRCLRQSVPPCGPLSRGDGTLRVYHRGPGRGSLLSCLVAYSSAR